MMFAAFLRKLRSRRYVRPWALSAPILILLISIPLLRPLHSPDPSRMSDEEQGRLATIQAIVESKSLAIEGTVFRDTRDQIVGIHEVGDRFPTHFYSNQPPMLALLMSGPYWVMHRAHYTLDRDPNAVIFWLTLLGVTLPVALSGGLVYRMGRTFELQRPLRALLALVVVIGSGLISYSTVINAHAPAAALLIMAAACLVHVIAHNRPVKAAPWLWLTGLLAALAATIDPPALIFLGLLILVIAAFRWPVAMRLAGVMMYVIGAALPLLVHARLNRPITGDLRPGIFHPELAVMKHLPDTAETAQSGEAELAAFKISAQPAPLVANPGSPAPAGVNLPSVTPTVMPPVALTLPHSSPATALDDDDDQPQTRWHIFFRGCGRIIGAFVGGHGVFSHFPVIILGIIGVTLIMHRHWPAATKMMAGATLGGALLIIVVHSLCRSDLRDAMFATRWYVPFLPLTLFWAGAWLRRTHRRSTWVIAGVLLAFSVTASIIGATGPLPRDGFDRYTVTEAWHNLTHPIQSQSLPSPIADRGVQDAFTE